MLARHREQIWHRNTWGDALYVVLSDAVQAAACALELQEALAAIDLEANGLPGHLAQLGKLVSWRAGRVSDRGHIGLSTARGKRWW